MGLKWIKSYQRQVWRKNWSYTSKFSKRLASLLLHPLISILKKFKSNNYERVHLARWKYCIRSGHSGQSFFFSLENENLAKIYINKTNMTHRYQPKDCLLLSDKLILKYRTSVSWTKPQFLLKLISDVC